MEIKNIPVGLHNVYEAINDHDTKKGFMIGNWFHLHEPKPTSFPHREAHEYARKKCQTFGYDCSNRISYDGVTTRKQYWKHINKFTDEWFEKI